MSTIDKEHLLKAARALQASAGKRWVKEASEAQLEAIIRSSPLMATLPNPPGPGEPFSVEQLEALIRNYHIAEALGITS